MSFEDSVTKYRSIYFHFLDGLLNTTSGGNFDNVVSTLKDITPGLLPKDITFGELKFRNGCIKIRNGPIIEYDDNHLSEDQIVSVLTPNDLNYDYFNFVIFPIFFNKHQTTTIIFKKLNKLYLYILNTGLDIQYNGDIVQIDSQDLCQLTKGICICDFDKNEELNAYNIIRDFFYISFFYDYISTSKYYLEEDNNYIFNPIFKNKLVQFKNIFSEDFISQKKIFILDEYKTKKDKNISRYITIDELLTIIDENPIFKNTKFLKFDLNYYVFASKFIDLNTPINIGSIDNINILPYNQNIISQLEGRPKLSENFLKKIILYNQNNNLYINDQESGSCTWYSIYFSILLYYVVRNHQVNYLQFINEINYQFYSYIIKVYTKPNFIKEFQKKNQDNSEKSYYYMLKLCSKLIDINLLSRNLLYEIQDIVYDTKLNIEIYSNNEDLDIVKDYYDDDNLITITNLLGEYNYDIDEYYLTSFLIYVNKKETFFKSHIDTISILESLKTYIFEKYQNYSLSNNLSTYILMFENTYKLTVDMDNHPSYLTYFIPIILYINNNPYSQPLPLDFNQNKSNLFECCIIFLRFFILLKILKYCNKHTYDDQEFTNLISLSVLPLINIKLDSEIEFVRNNESMLFQFSEDILNLNIFELIIPKDNLENVKLELLDSFDEKFDSYLKIEEILFQNFNLITPNFLIYNMKKINENQELKTKLIKFYCKFLYNKEVKLIYYEYIYILIFNYHYNDGIIRSKINIESFREKINDLKTKLSYKDFEMKILNEIGKFFNDKFTIIPNYNYENITINNINYEKVLIICSLFKDTVLINEDFDPNTQKKLNIYQIIDNNYIKYKCISTNTNEFKILKIYFNGYQVLKFHDIIYPFKYLIPNTDLYFIYNKNNTYNIAFHETIFYKRSYPNDRILGEIDRQKLRFHNYEINPNNQFFLNKFPSDETLNFKSWNNLCCDHQINGFNIMYVNFDNKKPDITGYSCNKKRYQDIFNFNKTTLFKEQLNDYNKINFKLLKNDKKNVLFVFKIEAEKTKKLTESYKKLLFKISKCNINYFMIDENLDKLKEIKLTIKSKIIKFTNYIKNITLGYLLDHYPILQSYLLNVKMYNFIDKLLLNIDNEETVCSIIKNYNNVFDTKQISFKYKFEILFELINGNEILKEQMERYITMFQPFYKDQGGGTIEDELKENLSSLINIRSNLNLESKPELLKQCEDNYYQLHHFMMGKGKSSIITPLLSLHLNIIKDQTIYIIVPKHLVNQTISTLQDYIDIFQIKNIFIKSEDDIKQDFLKGDFKNDNNNKVFLIDEFDSLMNPLKSNFNYVTNKSLNIDYISDIIKTIIELNKVNLSNNETIPQDILIQKINENKKIKNNQKLAENIFSIINQLNQKELKYNIQWGIDSENLYAIPFRSKDKPIENSSFVSCIQTIFLTYYYYIIIMNYKIDENILNFIKKNKYLKKFFRIDNSRLNIETVNILLEDETIKIDFYNTLFKEILNYIELPKEQYNTSFIDIINIDDIIKIGYSGTVNINLPNMKNSFRFDKKCIYPDEDESTNITHAILKSDIKNIDNLHIFDALIDICGFFYDKLNYDIALEIYTKLKREVIFIDEKDEKMVIRKNGNLEKLNENIIYEKPFFYYDQGHIVGIDIKQDNYPVLHGLCIVDDKSYYSEVAQAMFRLRKLNMGHQISFILNNFEIKNQQLLLEQFIKNEENLIEQQKDNLNLQTLKSDIRKKRKNDIFRERYKEKLFYYFINNLEEIDPLKLIFNEDELKSIDLNFYNLNPEKVRKIIFNLDFESHEIQHQISTQTQTQTQIQINKNLFNSYLDQFLTNFEKYKFKNFDFIKTIKNQINYDKYTFKLNNILSFLPNIFYSNCYSPNYFIKKMNYKYNFELIFIYVNEIKKFIIIPKYMLFYLWNDFIMYDFNFNILNENLRYLHNNTMINELEDNLFTKIITNTFTVDDFNLFEINLINAKIYSEIVRSTYLSALIYWYRFRLNINNKNKYYYNKLIGYFNINLQNIFKTLNFTKHDILIRNVIKPHKKESQANTTLLPPTERKIYSPPKSFYTLYPERWKNKYLKYKQKYLNLKKLYN